VRSSQLVLSSLEERKNEKENGEGNNRADEVCSFALVNEVLTNALTQPTSSAFQRRST